MSIAKVLIFAIACLALGVSAHYCPFSKRLGTHVSTDKKLLLFIFYTFPNTW